MDRSPPLDAVGAAGTAGRRTLKIIRLPKHPNPKIAHPTSHIAAVGSRYLSEPGPRCRAPKTARCAPPSLFMLTNFGQMIIF